jgi:acetyl-CoA acetyltransferase family protein
MNPVYIFYAKRTPIGNFSGILSSKRVDDLLSDLLKDFAKNHIFDLTEINDVIIGNANQAGEDNRNLARMSLILAEYPLEVPGTTINRLCGSSLDAIIDGACRIASGMNECVIAGGAEVMSRAPYVLSKAETSFDRSQKMYDTALGWRFPNPKMEKMFPLLSMGETAEEIQMKYKISRESQDYFAYESHKKAVQAIDQGIFKNEIVPIMIHQKKENILIYTDEGPRRDSSLEKLQTLKPVFKKEGTVTAGNSSSLNDGAAIVGICSEDFLRKNNLTPLCRIIGCSVAGLHPNIMGMGPVVATQKLLQKYNLKISDFNSIELNEAFAVQALACMQELKLDPTLVNINGGSIALGHPLGCTGARLVTTLTNQMKINKNIKKSLATMCIGVGQGISLAIENCQ